MGGIRRDAIDASVVSGLIYGVDELQIHSLELEQFTKCSAMLCREK